MNANYVDVGGVRIVVQRWRCELCGYEEGEILTDEHCDAGHSWVPAKTTFTTTHADPVTP